MKQTNYFYIAFALVAFVAFGQQASAQTAVGIGSTVFTPDVNSVLDIKSSSTGVLLPRMTADPSVAGNNDDGLIYFNTVSQTYRYYDEGANVWRGLLNNGGTNFINNQTTVQPTSNFNISAAGVIGTTLGVGTSATIGTTLGVGTSATVGTTLSVGNGITVGAVGTSGNILMSIDDSWIGTGASGSATTRIEFDKTSGTEGVKVLIDKGSTSTSTPTAMTIKNEGNASGVGLKLSGARGLAADESGFIDFENRNAPSTTDIETLARIGVKNSSADNTNGSFHISLRSSGALNERFVLKNNGDLEIDGKFTSNGIKETSDARFKKNISSISNALSSVLSFEGVTYNWRTEEFPERAFTERMEYGVIAQQIEKIVPELVGTDEDGYKSVQYSHMVPLLIEAIKEQQLIINSQSQEIGVLKASVDAISEHIKTAQK